MLALATSSCFSMALDERACEEFQRGKVIGFVDCEGSGDALSLRVDGEQCLSDGLYEVRVEREDDEKSDLDRLAPIWFNGATVATLQSIRLLAEASCALECVGH